MLTVIHEAESRVQQCLSRLGEEAGKVLCARAGMPILETTAGLNNTGKTLLKKHSKTQRAEPTETACRTHFQMHGIRTWL